MLYSLPRLLIVLEALKNNTANRIRYRDSYSLAMDQYLGRKCKNALKLLAKMIGMSQRSQRQSNMLIHYKYTIQKYSLRKWVYFIKRRIFIAQVTLTLTLTIT